MNRHDRRVAKAKAAKRFPELDLRAGRIAASIAGTVHWSDDGVPLGIWGVSKPRQYVQLCDGNRARALSPSEHKFVERIYGPIDGETAE